VALAAGEAVLAAAALREIGKNECANFF
jgi:hypothetical protein